MKGPGYQQWRTYLRPVEDRFQAALVAGIIPDWLVLPGGLLGRQRTARISNRRIGHIAARHPRWLVFCLSHMPEVLANPEYMGFRPASDARRVEFVRSVGSDPRLLLVSVKFRDAEDEAWVNSAHPLKERYLTRRLRAGTMQPVSRGP